MDLGISGRKAIVCASSRGLGRACAMALAQAGSAVVINGRDRAKLEATAAELRQATGASITAVEADGVAVPLQAQSGSGRRTLTLGAAAPGCAPGARGVVPTGVQLRLDDGATRYAAVGPALARWLLAPRCPSAVSDRTRPLGAAARVHTPTGLPSPGEAE